MKKLRIGDRVKIVSGDIHEGKEVTITEVNHTACFGLFNGTKIGFKMSEAVCLTSSQNPDPNSTTP